MEPKLKWVYFIGAGLALGAPLLPLVFAGLTWVACSSIPDPKEAVACKKEVGVEMRNIIDAYYATYAPSIEFGNNKKAP